LLTYGSLEVVNLDETALVVVSGFEGNPESSHPLVYKQKVAIVALGWFAGYAIADESIIAFTFVPSSFLVWQTLGLLVANTLVLVTGNLGHTPITVTSESLESRLIFFCYNYKQTFIFN